MLASNIKTVRTDVRSLLRDARDLFREATNSSGEKAEELRRRGLVLLDTAMEKAQEMQSAAVETSKEFASNTDTFVRSSPWTAVGISATFGLLVGMLIARR